MTCAPVRPPTASARRDESPRVLSTLNNDGSRRWITPRPSNGRYYNRRRVTAYALILVFTAIPYLRLNGMPLVLLDLAARRFTILGHTFLPTDTLLLALLLVGVFLTIFLLTALFGRVWCGWACPQTVYMEFVFRPIERLFEGAPGRAKGPLAGKGFSKPVKLVAYLIVSAYLAHTFLAYFVGVEQLRHWVLRSPLEHPGPFLVMLSVTALMMFDFALFREQTCIVACPYGRLQAALLDRDSLIVSYDRTRGEPRGKVRRPEIAPDIALPIANAPDERRGDCVDCTLCVQTCPTGIDIRDGLQMECIGCTQCIDACDAVMTKVGRPTGLIRYTSQARVAGERNRFLRPRIVIYPLALLAVAGAFVLVLLSQGPADVTILRGVGRPFVELPEGRIGNPIKVKIVNRTDKPAVFELTPSGATGIGLTLEENPVTIPAGKSRVLTGMLAVDAGAFGAADAVATVSITSKSIAFERVTTYRLMGPGSRRNSTQPRPPASQETKP